jgi:lipoprotein LenA
MKKGMYTLTVLFLSFILIQGCKKGDKQGLDLDPGDVVKYAKFTTAVYKDQEMKTWAATLAKTEPVKLIETLNVPVKGVNTEIAKVKLSDNTVVFASAKNLGDKPLVFIEDTKAYVRNNASSKVYAIIPKGTIGFVLQENADWVQVYVGQLDGKWITAQWVNSGFTTEDLRVQEAKLFEESAAILKNSASKADQKKQAEDNLKNLSTSTGIFAEMAFALLGTSDGAGNAGTETDGSGLGEATVQTAAGLTMRDQPSTSGKSIVIIPDGNTVKIIENGKTEETIAGKTSIWYKVEWNGNRGWVFGGFLAP